MRNRLLMVTLLALVASGYWAIHIHENTESLSASSSDEVDQAIAPLDAIAAAGESNTDDTSFVLDRDRLFDRGYVNDPALQHFARAHETSPACIIALAKRHYHDIPIETGECPSPLDTALNQSDFRQLPGPQQSHPYEHYPDAKLKAMAQWDAAAALVLARRVDDDQSSLRLYERALVLTGNPQALIEWLNYRTPGENLAPNQAVDIDQAKTGYEIYLVASAFGLGEGVAEYYRKRLAAAGVDTRDIEKEVRKTVDKLKDEHASLFPRGEES